MADTITHSWQTVEQAAVTLNCSTRTIARRIAGESIESRVDDNGRRLVLVETFGHGTDGDERQTTHVSDESEAAPFSPRSTTSLATPVSSDGGYNPAATSVLAALQTTIDTARADSVRARSGARWAWIGAATMAVAIGIAAPLLTGRLTRAETKLEMLQNDVATAKSDLERSRSDLLIISSAKAVADQQREAAEQQLTAVEALRQTAETQRIAVEAQLAAAKPQTETKAVTQKPLSMPSTSLFGRLVTLPLEPEPR